MTKEEIRLLKLEKAKEKHLKPLFLRLKCECDLNLLFKIGCYCGAFEAEQIIKRTDEKD